REERFADAKLLPGRHILGGVLPPSLVDVRVVPEGVPQPRGAERQERGHEDREGAAHAEGDMYRGPTCGAVRLEEIPGRLLVHVLVPEAGELDRLLHVDVLEVLTDLLPLLFDGANHRLVGRIEESGGRDLVVEVLVRERES